ncbi:MAG: L-aspartate oxidase, partial [Planctomycetota bacterium]
EAFDVADVRVSLKSLMGRLASVERDAEGLREAEDSINSLASYVMRHQFDSADGWELQNLLTNASLIVRSALARTESRGVHFRRDFPQRDDENWRRHLNVSIDAQAGHPTLGAEMAPIVKPKESETTSPC